MSGDDLYALLGVGREASQDEIKQHYRKLAKELHPDLNPDKPDVADRFKRISAAYSMLSDPDKRARYDRGEIDASGQERPEQHFYREYADDPEAKRFYAREGFADAASMHEFFADLFGAEGADGRAGGGQPGRRGGVRMRARGGDLSYTLAVDFIDAARGARRRVVVGDGRTLDLAIPAGVRDRQTLRLKGQGGPGFDGGPPGDAYVEVHVRPHALFRRKDQNVHLELPVSLAEAVLGGKVAVPTIDGPVTMTIPKGANSGTRLRLRGKGIVDPASGERGDQYVELELRLPATIDPELETLVRDWSAAHPYDPRAKMAGG